MTERAWMKAAAGLITRYDDRHWGHIAQDPRAQPGTGARIIQDMRMLVANLPGVMVAADNARAKRAPKPTGRAK